MEMLENLSPDVLIYIQNVRKYLTSSEEYVEYFGLNKNEEEFFDVVIELAQENFEEKGEPQLSIEQFEEAKTKIEKKPDMVGVFLSLGNFGMISLN